MFLALCLCHTLLLLSNKKFIYAQAAHHVIFWQHQKIILGGMSPEMVSLGV